ncbi:MAG TPA: LCP family protein [Rugosimonospora sp.]|nr:LCP family protein [Rugosimonospora sp.]
MLTLASTTALIGIRLLARAATSSITQANILGGARATPGTHLRGPLNFLLIGSNYRDWAPTNGERADSLMVVHVPAGMNRAYFVSIPRDLYYPIKPYPPTHFKGSTEKIDAALNYGGMPLMAQTIADLTGLTFNGAVETRFDGFEKAVQTLGGITICVDVKTVSVHIGHDRNGRFAAPYTNTGGHPVKVPGVTPQVYYPGCQHLAAWQALDYVRQRELLPNGDYDRQRHQQQFIVAVLKQLVSAGTLTDPIKLDRAVHDIGSGLTVDTNGTPILDFVYALKDIRPESIVGLRTPSHPQPRPPYYIVGDAGINDLWQALRDDTLDAFAAAHPQLVNKLHTAPGTP